MEMQSSNPTLNQKTLDAARVGMGEQAMTVQGTVNKTFILLAVLMATALWSWSEAYNPANAGFLNIICIGSAIGGFIVALVTMFNQKWSPVTAPLYAALEGLFLGAISAFFEMRYPGIVTQAVGITFALLFAMLLAYKSGWIQATPMFRKGIIIATLGIGIFYGIVWIASMFGIHPPGFLYQGTAIGIGFSLFVIGIATLNFILDFDLIESAARQGLGKYMEWYGAFAMMVTLIWLYMEVLRLLMKLNRRN